jgi:hypothetical protein
MAMKVICFDKAPSEYFEAWESVKPEGFTVPYWDEMISHFHCPITGTLLVSHVKRRTMLYDASDPRSRLANDAAVQSRAPTDFAGADSVWES